MRYILIALCGFSTTLHASPFSRREEAPSVVQPTVDSWTKYQIDEWLPTFMQEKGLSKHDFLTAFPKVVGRSDLQCSLEKPCTSVINITTDANETDIKVNLVLSALTLFNDLFRIVNRLYTPAATFNHPVRNTIIEIFQDTYSYFSPNDINKTVPAQTFAHILFIPVWYIPNALPSEPLRQTINAAIAETATNGFGYEWLGYADNAPDSYLSNIQNTVQAAFVAWRNQYDQIISGRGNLTVLDFLEGGNLLKLKYAKELKKSSWHEQAFQMFARLTLSMVLEANGIIIHRGSYETVQPEDAAMGLNGWHDDSYSHTVSAMIWWGLDKNGSLTRQYMPQGDFKNDLHIAPRVIYGQSHDCFQATIAKDGETPYTSGYKKIWPWDLPEFGNSLYIPDWDGTGDGFDYHNPTCTFNIPVNFQPADIKTSWFMQELAKACPNRVEFDLDYFTAVTAPVYRACMVASDSWMSTQVALQYEDANVTANLKDFCDASAQAAKDFGKSVLSEIWSSFKTNLWMTALLGFKDTLSALKTAYGWAGSAVKGAWDGWVPEAAPVLEHPPRVPPPSIEPPREAQGAAEANHHDSVDSGESHEAGSDGGRSKSSIVIGSGNDATLFGPWDYEASSGSGSLGDLSQDEDELAKELGLDE
ncbi:hypothetical protein ACLMJK_001486 [Lecanora helva]